MPFEIDLRQTRAVQQICTPSDNDGESWWYNHCFPLVGLKAVPDCLPSSRWPGEVEAMWARAERRRRGDAGGE
jgi:hypothetical protein